MPGYAQLRDRRCRKSKDEIAEQLSGHWREDHLFSLRQSLQMYDAIAERITAYEQEILKKLASMEIEGMCCKDDTSKRRSSSSVSVGISDTRSAIGIWRSSC